MWESDPIYTRSSPSTSEEKKKTNVVNGRLGDDQTRAVGKMGNRGENLRSGEKSVEFFI